MAETVTKTVLDVDKLFSQIVVNGEVHNSTRYVAPTTVSAVTPSSQQSQETQNTTSSNNRTTQGADVYAVELNDVLHNFVDQAVTEGLQNEVRDREREDNYISNSLANETQQRYLADQALEGSIEDIEAVIPNQATTQNQLADKAFVNSSIATNTANFMGTFTSLAQIQAIQNPTNNDYAFLETTDQAGNTLYSRYKYSADSQEWLFEYNLNNSSFTAEQWATINSGLTQQSVTNEIEEAIALAGKIPVSFIAPFYRATAPAGWLVCDGRDTTGTDEELSTYYPLLYAILGSNKLPDLQEVTLVGIGHNITNIFDSNEINPATQQAGTQVHDEYNLGEFKDDQLQGHWHIINQAGIGAGQSKPYPLSVYNGNNRTDNVIANNAISDGTNGTPRVGTTTHGRQIGVLYCIKAT